MKNYFLITGANGFLGREIIYQFLTSGKFIKGTDIADIVEIPEIIYQKADITKKSELIPILESVSTIIHAAGIAHIFSPDLNSAKRFKKINETGTVNVALQAAAAGVGHFILISSVSVYGPYTHGSYDENTHCDPIGPYALSKYNAEQRAIEIARSAGMALTILRLSTLYGEGDPGNIKRLISSIDHGKFFWIGIGKNRKSLLYKGDAARACRTVALSPASGIRIFNVSGPPCNMKQIVDTLCEALGKRPLPGKVPGSVALPLSKIVSSMPINRFKNIHGIVKKWLAEDVYDTSKFENIFDFKPEVGIEEGLRREVEWYRQTQSADYAD